MTIFKLFCKSGRTPMLHALRPRAMTWRNLPACDSATPAHCNTMTSHVGDETASAWGELSSPSSWRQHAPSTTQRDHTTTSTIAASTCLRLSLQPSVSSTSARQRSAHRHNGLFTSHELNGTGVEFARTTVWTSALEYTGWSDVTASMVTTRSPFCGYNTT